MIIGQLNWSDLEKRWQKLADLFKLIDKIIQEKKLRAQMTVSDFWENQDRAKTISQLAENLKTTINHWQAVITEIKEAKNLSVLATEEVDERVLADLQAVYLKIEHALDSLENELLFSGPHDQANAILAIHAGTGGIDAQDWAQMLERMYLRFAEKMSFQVEVIDRLAGQEAGLKNVVFKVSAPLAYAWLKSEHGVHRLGRISPFDGENLRQTSFALVEVLPDLGPASPVEIKEEDLRIDVFRSSGPGGQSVNTTDSAVRVVHLPTGLTVSCQSGRSQHQNRENALNLLRAKLVQLALDNQEKETNQLKGQPIKAEWGQQIRSYILYGRRLVKDHRSQWESSDPDKVLGGDLEDCILAYLRLQVADKLN